MKALNNAAAFYTPYCGLGLERLHEEVKRRTRVARLFPNEASLLRLVSTIEMGISEDWVAGKRCLNMKTEMENENESANSGKKRIYRKKYCLIQKSDLYK
ncbi:MAG: transposase [Deltaproteobacteria bacterium]|nr:transposase [Deltaproteobacteria bacterium]